MTRTTALTRCGSVPDLARYDHILIYLSGDKDSIACLDAVLAAMPIPHGSSGTITTWTAPAPR
jgi:hypothetical protein